jgi:hypothetical protein
VCYYKKNPFAIINKKYFFGISALPGKPTFIHQKMLSYTIHMDTRLTNKIQPGKPQIMPGLPIRANLEKPVKWPDPIRAIFKP